MRQPSGKLGLIQNHLIYPLAKLYMAAVVAIRHNSHIKALYARLLAKGKSKMSAIGAAMRKLVHLCFGVLKTRTPYQVNYVKST
ncbi:hypothetical protein FACS1894116_00630 [Betaproteobacteria bacterium]|nr:hypothetical protein FACS1894116_00630 [Betaproteobacteria bacterium]GHU28391.1 hypothetical protein FACS189497_03750 [Betaproteobacteria bacterium]